MIPHRYRVTKRIDDTPDTITILIEPIDDPLPAAQPGQFHMLYAFGVGEVPISVSGVHQHTLRAVGAVTRALRAVQPGSVIGVRGPFGRGWQVPPLGHDLILVGGGIGLAPLRPVICHALEHRGDFGRVTVAIGARSAADLLYPDEFATWADAGITVLSTVDIPSPEWTGHVGVVTTVLPGLVSRPLATAAMVCGPEVMMRFVARALISQGLAAQAIQVSLERNMRCGTAECGHCQLGPLLVCRDGPVVTYAQAEPLLAVKEL